MISCFFLRNIVFPNRLISLRNRVKLVDGRMRLLLQNVEGERARAGGTQTLSYCYKINDVICLQQRR